jgi:hypothetical protein
VRRENPTVDRPDVTLAKDVGGDAGPRRHRRDPSEALDDDEETGPKVTIGSGAGQKQVSPPYASIRSNSSREGPRGTGAS